MMSRIRSKDTKPERTVRSWLHRNGYRFRINRKDLPGTPDIVLPKYRTVIFVNGCFWHRHNCKLAYTPKSNVERWSGKFKSNVERDDTVKKLCSNQGWRPLEVWECEVRDGTFSRRLREELTLHEGLVIE
jgi:DNA mismatch endonuclease (patch repair protein)